MPPAISSGDEGSDVDLDNATVTTKKAGREKKKPVLKEEVKDEEEEQDVPDENNGAASDDDDEGDEEEDGEGDGEVYVVEKILEHMMKNGEPLFKVKWEGYDAESDLTWEPESNLNGAAEILREYLSKIGGREALFKQTSTALKGKKRGRPATGTSQAGGKRSKRNGDTGTDSEQPLAVRSAAWKPPAGSWEDHIAQLDACEDEESGKLMVYLTWKNGHKTQHETSVIYQRCPQKMLQFYERHVRIIKREDPDAESVSSAKL